jgi:uncharacterized protein YqeY
LTDAESQQILATMIKQRRDSIEQFTKGGRPELAAKEATEIAVIEEFLAQGPRVRTSCQPDGRAGGGADRRGRRAEADS